jgi:hypothetical protein
VAEHTGWGSILCGIKEQEGLEQEGFQAVLRVAGGTETAQGNIQDLGFQLLTN